MARPCTHLSEIEDVKSPKKRASKHARATSHPVIASAEPGERWLYCFPDDEMAEY